MADFGESPILGSGVDRGKFAEHVAVAHPQPGSASPEFQVLGFCPDTGERKNIVLLSQIGASFHRGVVMDAAAPAHSDFGADIGVSSNFDPLLYPGPAGNHGSRMNGHDYRPSSATRVNISWAEETNLPSTLQVARAIPILLALIFVIMASINN